MDMDIAIIMLLFPVISIHTTAFLGMPRMWLWRISAEVYPENGTCSAHTEAWQIGWGENLNPKSIKIPCFMVKNQTRYTGNTCFYAKKLEPPHVFCKKKWEVLWVRVENKSRAAFNGLILLYFVGKRLVGNNVCFPYRIWKLPVIVPSNQFYDSWMYPCC